MEKTLENFLQFRYPPAALRLTDEAPAGALSFPEGKWGCIMALTSSVFKQGKTACFSKATCTCMGGRIGFGFTENYPEGFDEFLSCGDENGECPLPNRKPEGYKASPAWVKLWREVLPTRLIKEKYVVIEPLSSAKEPPNLVIFYVTPDQLSALVVLANYARAGAENVAIPHAAGCQSICLLPLAECEKESPRAIVGMMDISARPFIDKDLLSVTMPYAMFRTMEEHIPNSFLEREAWKRIAPRLG